MIIVSGMRPTGALHIGHLFGALNNWKKLQDEGNRCYFFVADWHALTSEFKNTERVAENTEEMVIDWLSCGIDPERSTLFVQSSVKEHAELFLLLSQITPLGWLERSPTYKEMKNELPDKDLSNYGFLGYPVLQAADVLLYKADAVPVGQDQLPHLELIREITRRFNNFYGNVFPEPKSLLSETPKISGTDGRKMSKSFNNAILLTDSDEEINKKVMSMFTDKNRLKREMPGDPGVCNLFPLHRFFTEKETASSIEQRCRKADIGCVDDKKILIDNIIKFMTPVREKRKKYEKDPSLIQQIIRNGNEKASEAANKTMKDVNRAMKLI
jgi:tryptophanyl-tRNA synthetase